MKKAFLFLIIIAFVSCAGNESTNSQNNQVPTKENKDDIYSDKCMNHLWAYGGYHFVGNDILSFGSEGYFTKYRVINDSQYVYYVVGLKPIKDNN